MIEYTNSDLAKVPHPHEKLGRVLSPEPRDPKALANTYDKHKRGVLRVTLFNIDCFNTLNVDTLWNTLANSYLC